MHTFDDRVSRIVELIDVNLLQELLLISVRYSANVFIIESVHEPVKWVHSKDMRVRSLEAMRRLFVLVLLTALFVAFLDATWPLSAVGWLRSLGGKLGLKTDLDGLYLLLAGISFVFTTAATFSFACAHPFPFSSFSYG
jgi:hypothetical protein